HRLDSLPRGAIRVGTKLFQSWQEAHVALLDQGANRSLANRFILAGYLSERLLDWRRRRSRCRPSRRFHPVVINEEQQSDCDEDYLCASVTDRHDCESPLHKKSGCRIFFLSSPAIPFFCFASQRERYYRPRTHYFFWYVP